MTGSPGILDAAKFSLAKFNILKSALAARARKASPEALYKIRYQKDTFGTLSRPEMQAPPAMRAPSALGLKHVSSPKAQR